MHRPYIEPNMEEFQRPETESTSETGQSNTDDDGGASTIMVSNSNCSNSTLPASIATSAADAEVNQSIQVSIQEEPSISESDVYRTSSFQEKAPKEKVLRASQSNQSIDSKGPDQSSMSLDNFMKIQQMQDRDDRESVVSSGATSSCEDRFIRGFPAYALRYATPLLDQLPNVVDLESGPTGPLAPENVPTSSELENQRRWFESLRSWIFVLVGIANCGLFVLFTPSIFDIGTDGFRWSLLFVMLPWLGWKFIVALFAHCTRQRLNKFVSFTNAGGQACNPSLVEPSLCVFVPVWRENEIQLKRTLLSVKNGYYSKDRVSIVVVIDECAPEVAYNCLQILFGPERAEWMHKSSRRHFRWFSFSSELRPYYVADGITEEGIHAMVFMKYQNKRKWDSIVFFFLLQRYLFREARWLSSDYLLCVDSDTQLVETDTHQSMRQMVTRFEQMPRVLAACGETCVANIDSGIITKSQVWEYFASFQMDKMYESFFGRVVCLPGCMTAFRGSMIFSDEFFFEVLKPFAARPDQSSLVSHICKEKGEDRWLTLLLIDMANKLKPRGTIEYFPEASCTTNVPTDSASFISQRYRWTSSTYACLLRSPVSSMGWGVGVSWMLDSFSALFFLAFTLHFYYSILAELIPAFVSWSALSPVLVGELLMLLMLVGMQCVVAFSTNREHAFGYAWAYICRQYIFLYCFWIPLGTLWTLNNVKAWEGSRTAPADNPENGGKAQGTNDADKFFAPANKLLVQHQKTMKLEQLERLKKEVGGSDSAINIQNN